MLLQLMSQKVSREKITGDICWLICRLLLLFFSLPYFSSFIFSFLDSRPFHSYKKSLSIYTNDFELSKYLSFFIVCEANKNMEKVQGKENTIKTRIVYISKGKQLSQSIISNKLASYSLIVQWRVVVGRTVVVNCDWLFDNPSGGYHLSQGTHCSLNLMMNFFTAFETFVTTTW